MKSELSYTTGRIFGVVTRPACLFLANNLLEPLAAQALAVVFLASSLALVGVAADPHRRFYARYFSSGPAVNGVTFYIYAASVGLLIACGSVLVVAVVWHFTQSGWLATAATGYFLFEKLADEVLRFRLFERRFTIWGRVNTTRNVLQLVIFGGFIWLFRTNSALPLVVFMLTAANAAVLVPQLPSGLRQGFRRARLSTILRITRRATASLYQNRRLWMIALLTSGIGYLDRLVALIIDQASLPLFMIVVMCFSIMGMAVDYYFVSRHRREFLERKISVMEAIASKGFSASMMLGLLVAGIACLLVLHYSHNGAEFPLVYVLVIATLQATVAIASVLREILYWSPDLSRIVIVETVFWATFALTVLLTRGLGVNVTTIFSLAVSCAILRVALYFVFAWRAGANHWSV